MEDDADLFAKAMRGVTPLKSSKQHFFKPKPKIFEPPNNVKISNPLFDELLAETITSEQILSFKRPGLQDKTFRKLKQGKIMIEAEIDLHGLIVDEARNKLYWFIQNSVKNHLRCVLIIHGKGKNSVNSEPVLKSRVNSWLKQSDEILAFCSAQINDGGAGAVYIYLRA